MKKFSKPQSSSLLLPAKPFKLSYLGGTVIGNIALDTVSFGPFEISSQVFGEC